jgi:uncharacterized protein (TIGR04255 family)
MFPKKLKNDSIVEALCEVHFQSDELPEIIIGRLSDGKYWRSFLKKRLPFADIPRQIRKFDEQLEYQPILELRDSIGQYRVQIGENVFSYHVVGKYCGGENFLRQLALAFETLFTTLNGISISKIMFIYLNALTTDKHHILDMKSLNLDIGVNKQALTEPANLNYLVKNDDSHQTMTRIVSAYFVNGELPENTSVVLDIDVSTPKNYQVTTKEEILEWIKKAHQVQKDAFFSLIPTAILEKMVE